ncbi:MAG: hypothetical protein FWD52_03480 [Candidatus Bathyarchaeota archaeon]|nr:hypothetical protein [Candidatus Termiticorpusculum sp.]
MVHLIRRIQTSTKKGTFKKIFAFAIIVILFFSSILTIEALLSPSSNKPKPSENVTVLTLALYQSIDYTEGGKIYEFKYMPGGQGNLLQISTDGQTPISYAAIPGATYNPFNLKITIYSANEKMLVLHIAPP